MRTPQKILAIPVYIHLKIQYHTKSMLGLAAPFDPSIEDIKMSAHLDLARKIWPQIAVGKFSDHRIAKEMIFFIGPSWNVQANLSK